MSEPRNGCRNSDRRDGYYVHVRKYQPSGRFLIVQKFIRDESSRECKYDFRATDKLCAGCAK